jgi:YD repeat-containing protein
MKRVYFYTDAIGTTTAYAYDPLNRKVQETVSGANHQPLTTNHYSYDPEGCVTATSGSTYPVAYEYDDYGRMTARLTAPAPALRGLT